MKVFLTGAAGYIGGSIAAELAAAGHQVCGLVRKPQQAEQLGRLGITPVLGDLDDATLLSTQARAADAVVNAASSDHRGAVLALIDGLAGSGKPFLHTSGSSIVGDASGGAASAQIHDEEHLPAPTKDKAARVAIDQLVLAAAAQNVRSAVLCNTLIYGHGLGLARDSVQIPRLVAQARKNGVVRHVGTGRNIWSNVHIADVALAYRLALEKTPAGTFYFIESGEAAYRELSTAIAKALNLPGPEDWPLEEAIKEWGYEMASYALGSNSRVRGKRAPALLGWKPTHGTSAPDWIVRDLV